MNTFSADPLVTALVDGIRTQHQVASVTYGNDQGTINIVGEANRSHTVAFRLQDEELQASISNESAKAETPDRPFLSARTPSEVREMILPALKEALASRGKAAARSPLQHATQPLSAGKLAL